MGCCVTNENRIAPDQIQRRNFKYHVIDGRVNSQVYTQQRVKPAKFQINQEDKVMLHKAISSHSFLFRLPNIQRNRLIQCFEPYECQQGKQIFKKGDQASLFFIIKSGSVQICVNAQQEQKRSVLERGNHFGDLALLYTAPRSATAKSVTKCEFYCISHQIFRKTAQQIVKKNYQIAKNFIEKIPIFKFLTKREKTLITYNTLVLKYQKDEIIFKEGDDANSFYVIASGRVQIKIACKEPLQMSVGQSFGQNSFKKNQIRSGLAVALEKTSLISIGRQSLKKCLGNQLEDISFYNILKWSLNRDSLFSMASKVQREKMIANTQITTEKQGQIICQQGSTANYLIIILDGEINGYKAGNILNKEYLASESQNDIKITERLVQTKTGNFGKIAFNVVHSIFGKKMNLLLNKTASKQIMLELQNKRAQYVKLLDLKQFIVKIKLGEGQFGKVYLIEDKLNKQYAIKCIQKNKIIQHKMQHFVLKQKGILQLINHQFIIKLYKTFKDDYFIYFLLNVINGADFFDLLRQIGICSKNKAQFYSGCMILALQHLHDKNIIYRDLKPQNAVVDQSGYLFLIDMGIAKILTQENGYRTFTVIGTPHYMAPEIVELAGYSFSSDLWSLGIILYQMLCGQLPYGNDIQDPYEIFKQIYAKQLKFPKFLQDISAKQLISKLLSKNPTDRFVEQFSKLKNMSFYNDFDWQQLSKKEIKPPLKIKPKTKENLVNQFLLNYVKRQKANLGTPLKSEVQGWDQQF